MGQVISYGLTQYDVEELIQYCDGAFSQYEIEALYRRFRALDRGRKGFISSEELLRIPELSINPLAQRILRLFENVNFREFVGLLAPFSHCASTEDKLQCMFRVYDLDGDGVITFEDMQLMLRQLVGSSLSDATLNELINTAFEQAGVKDGVDLKTFKVLMKDRPLTGMVVDVPVEL